VDAILNLSSADLDTFKEIEDAYKNADSSISTTVTNLQSSHNGDITALDTRLDTAEAKSSYTDPTTQTLLTAEAGTRAAADTALDTRLDTAEAKSSFTDPTTQTLLTAEASTRAAADTALDTRLDTAEAKSSYTDPTTQTLLNTEKARIDTNVTAIGLNTSKNTFPTASNTLLHSTHATLHTTHTSTLETHTTQIATKLNTTGNQTMTGKMHFGHEGGNGVTSYNSNTDDLVILNHNDVGITIGAPEGKIGSLTFCDQNKADRNQIRAYSTVRDSRNIGMHLFANQADTEVPSLSVNYQSVGINNAQPTQALDCIGTIKASNGLVLTKTVLGTALEWPSHAFLIETTIDDVRSGSIPIYSSFSMSGVQRFFLEVTSNKISSDSVVLVHTWSPTGYEDWLPQVSNLRSMYNSSGNKFRITGSVSGTHDESSNTGTPNLFVNYVIM
jgi:hypothetical protein